MNYLFFDLEFATSRRNKPRICEFGYVMTDESFRVLKRGNLITDPNIPRCEWDYRVVKKILTRPISVYERAPRFPAHYEEISDLIASADLIFGHTMDMDAHAINCDCKRYGLPSVDFSFWDVHRFFIGHMGEEKDSGLAAILAHFEIEGEGQVHDAEADAYNTMQALRALLGAAECTVWELCGRMPEAENGTENFRMRSELESQKRQMQDFLDVLHGDGTNDVPKKGVNRRRLIQFMENVKPTHPRGCRLLGKCVVFSGLYEAHHFKEILHLMQRVVNQSGTVARDVSKCQIYVYYPAVGEDGAPLPDGRLEAVRHARERGAEIEVWEWEDFLALLGITEEDLVRLPPISFDFLLTDGAVISDKRDRLTVARILGKEIPEEEEENASPEDRGGVVYSTEDVPATLGDLFADVFAKFAPVS